MYVYPPSHHEHFIVHFTSFKEHLLAVRKASQSRLHRIVGKIHLQREQITFTDLQTRYQPRNRIGIVPA